MDAALFRVSAGREPPLDGGAEFAEGAVLAVSQADLAG